MEKNHVGVVSLKYPCGSAAMLALWPQRSFFQEDAAGRGNRQLHAASPQLHLSLAHSELSHGHDHDLILPLTSAHTHIQTHTHNILLYTCTLTHTHTHTHTHTQTLFNSLYPLATALHNSLNTHAVAFCWYL